MDLRQKRDIRRLGRQIIQIIFFLWMPALYTSAFSGVRYVIEQILSLIHILTGYLRSNGDYNEALKMGTAAGSATAFSEDVATGEKIMSLYETL